MRNMPNKSRRLAPWGMVIRKCPLKGEFFPAPIVFALPCIQCGPGFHSKKRTLGPQNTPSKGFILLIPGFTLLFTGLLGLVPLNYL